MKSMHTARKALRCNALRVQTNPKKGTPVVCKAMQNQGQLALLFLFPNKIKKKQALIFTFQALCVHFKP